MEIQKIKLLLTILYLNSKLLSSNGLSRVIGGCRERVSEIINGPKEHDKAGHDRVLLIERAHDEIKHLTH